jgi:hypothetical protein
MWAREGGGTGGGGIEEGYIEGGAPDGGGIGCSTRCCAANDASLASDGLSCLAGLFELGVRKEPNIDIPAPPPSPPPKPSFSTLFSNSSEVVGWPTSHEGAARFSLRRSRSSARCFSISGVSVRVLGEGEEEGIEEGIRGGGGRPNSG